MDFLDNLNNIVKLIDKKLEYYLPLEDTPQKSVIESMRYSVNAGGKRLRPVLSLAVANMLEMDYEEIIPYAIAIELIHTYSLIHDDLPCMDDDDLRRGKPTNHKVFGEAMAVLAGDALLNKAFQIMIEASIDCNNKVGALKTMKYIANASSYNGMIGGQIIDMENEDKIVKEEELKNMHNLKTGAIISASILAPAIYFDAEAKKKAALSEYAQNLGLAFQIKDDILDVEGNEMILGKKIGSDISNGKTTYVTLFGLEKSKEMLETLTKDSINSLSIFGDKADFLKELAIYLLKRNN